MFIVMLALIAGCGLRAPYGAPCPPAPAREFVQLFHVTSHPQMPDAKLTPGEVRMTDEVEVCNASTKEYRHTTKAMKEQVCARYHVLYCPQQGVMEIDHLIPLELGGADTIANLWVQFAEPRPGYHEKDKLENYLHEQVCAGKVPLINAQAVIRSDWYHAYLEAGLDKR